MEALEHGEDVTSTNVPAHPAAPPSSSPCTTVAGQPSQHPPAHWPPGGPDLGRHLDIAPSIHRHPAPGVQSNPNHSIQAHSNHSIQPNTSHSTQPNSALGMQANVTHSIQFNQAQGIQLRSRVPFSEQANIPHSMQPHLCAQPPSSVPPVAAAAVFADLDGLDADDLFGDGSASAPPSEPRPDVQYPPALGAAVHMPVDDTAKATAKSETEAAGAFGSTDSMEDVAGLADAIWDDMVDDEEHTTSSPHVPGACSTVTSQPPGRAAPATEARGCTEAKQAASSSSAQAAPYRPPPPPVDRGASTHGQRPAMSQSMAHAAGSQAGSALPQPHASSHRAATALSVSTQQPQRDVPPSRAPQYMQQRQQIHDSRQPRNPASHAKGQLPPNLFAVRALFTQT